MTNNSKENPKVTLPKEVAEAIEKLRNEGRSDVTIIIQAHGAIFTPDHVTIKEWAFNKDGEGTPELLLSALVNGYVVEKSPEDKVREYYEGFSEPGVGRFIESEQYVISKTLDLLGIKIDGINSEK